MISESIKESIEVLLANRYFIYSLLHKVFGADPSKELLDILTSDQAAASFTLLSEEENDIMSKAGKFLIEVRADLSDPAFLGQVKDEYNRLFVGPVKLIAPPWESVYRGKEAMLFQESTLEVREFYRSYGFIPQGYPRVADDSLALEMDFMARLAGRALDALKADDEAGMKKAIAGSKLFLSTHLLVWIPKFMEKMKSSQSDCLYPQMCLILEDYLKKDRSCLTQITEVLE